MELIRGIDSAQLATLGSTIITVGSFDGVHRGHSSLLSTLVERAQQSGHRSVVVSFSPHPRVALGRSEGLELLSTDSEKAVLLERAGVDALLLVEFTPQFSNLSYEQFIEEYLIRKANMREIVMGFNHHIGHNMGTFEDITKLAAKLNFEVTLAPEFRSTDLKISSTTIRKALAKGDIALSRELLSHPYLIMGRSDSEGKVTIDNPLKLIPPTGLYNAVVCGLTQRVTIDSEQNIWCSEKSQDVSIELIDKI